MIVLDASVWLASQIPNEPQHGISLAWRDAHLAAGERISVPNLFLVEIGGAIVRRSRDADQARRNVQRIQADPLFVITDTDPLVDLIIDTAITASLRGADAVYVALARRLEVPLVTWDREIGRKAGHLVDVQQPAIPAAT